MHSPHTSSLKTKTEMQSKALSVSFLVQYQVMSARKVQLAIMRTTAGHLSWEQTPGDTCKGFWVFSAKLSMQMRCLFDLLESTEHLNTGWGEKPQLWGKNCGLLLIQFEGYLFFCTLNKESEDRQRPADDTYSFHTLSYLIKQNSIKVHNEGIWFPGGWWWRTTQSCSLQCLWQHSQGLCDFLSCFFPFNHKHTLKNYLACSFHFVDLTLEILT